MSEIYELEDLLNRLEERERRLAYLIGQLESVVAKAAAPPKPTESPYYTCSQAAAYLHSTPKSIQGLVEAGSLRPFRGSRNRYLFTKEMLDDYVARKAKR
jgi:excisionase family DNA binding protein